MKTLALFDFDGTITNGDSLFEFLRVMVGWPAALKGAPEVLLHWFGLLFQANISHDTAKEALLKVHMRNRTRAQWEQAVRDFNAQLRPDYYNAAVLDDLRMLRHAGATVAIVSASIDIWLSPFAQAESAELICTRSLWKNERWVGFEGKNCRGAEKVRRINEAFSLEKFDKIIAYGNAPSDFPMLELADEAWYIGRKGSLQPWER